MKRFICILLLIALGVGCASAQRKTDALDRGLVAIYKSSYVFVSWRVQADEYYDVKYNLYRGSTLIAENLDVSNYTDTGGTTSSKYKVSAVINGVEQTACDPVSVWSTQDGNGNPYLNIQMQDVVDRNGDIVYCSCGSHTPSSDVAQNYILNDCSVADLDGDGEMEIIVKRINESDASSTDAYAFNSEIYSTTNTRAYVLLEAYKLDGTRLWWIDCGPNMVSMNSTEINIIAYDWDQDGKAEVILRGADNMIVHKSDGTKYYIGDSSVNTRGDLNSHTDSQYAWTHTGAEYLIYLDGATGAKYQVIDYPLPRFESDESGMTEQKVWSPNNSRGGYGHRSNKFFFGAPVLDGRKASVFLARGIYTQTKMCALDVDPATHAISTRWTWRCKDTGSDWFGQGNHNMSIADVDGDGCDEIIYGSMVIDNNGKGLSTTGLGHGDAMHVGDFDPYRKGLEVFACNEDSPAMNYRDATTSEFYYRVTASDDDGRALMDNFTNDYPGSVGRSVKTGFISSVADKEVTELGGDSFINWGDLNWRIYWDGDLCSEYLESPGTEREFVVYKPGTSNRLIQGSGTKLNNDSKNNPCFAGDIIGDWREEVVVRSSDNNSLRVYSTSYSTNYKMPSLWFDPEYRQAMVWQVCGYNQPPHVSYFMGEMEGLTKVPVPLTMTGRTEVAASGDCIPTSANGSPVIVYGLGNIGIPTEGASPSQLIVDVPSTVSGSGSNSGIGYSYSTSNLGYDSYKGALTGGMHLVKQGDGLLKITNRTFAYTGNTDIFAGSVYFRGTLTNSPVWMNRFTTMYTAGTYKRSFTMEYGSRLYVNYSYCKADGTAPATEYTTANIDTLNLHEGARVVFDIDQVGGQSDVLNIKQLSLRKRNWTYGPEYLAPVFQFNSTATLAVGMYKIGTISNVDGQLSGAIIEGTFADGTEQKLLVKDNTLYLKVSMGAGSKITGDVTTYDFTTGSTTNGIVYLTWASDYKKVGQSGWTYNSCFTTEIGDKIALARLANSNKMYGFCYRYSGLLCREGSYTLTLIDLTPGTIVEVSTSANAISSAYKGNYGGTWTASANDAATTYTYTMTSEGDLNLQIASNSYVYKIKVTEPDYYRGDVNGDDDITLEDLTALIALLNNSSASIPKAADADGDGEVNLDDAETLLDVLLER